MFPFMHLVGGWILGKSFEIINFISLNNLEWFLLLFSSILPDFDFGIDWFFKKRTHRTFTHSLFFVISSFFLGFFLLEKIGVGESAIFISLGILIHIFLDMVSKTGVMLFWPYQGWFSFFNINKKIITKFQNISDLKYQINFLIFDIVIGLIWFSYIYLQNIMPHI